MYRINKHFPVRCYKAAYTEYNIERSWNFYLKVTEFKSTI